MAGPIGSEALIPNVAMKRFEPISSRSRATGGPTHPSDQQAALSGALAEVGWVAEVTVNQTTGHVVDGPRIELALARREPTVPVTYVELSEDEERLGSIDRQGPRRQSSRDLGRPELVMEGGGEDDSGLLAAHGQLHQGQPGGQRDQEPGRQVSGPPAQGWSAPGPLR
jgi:hypothetical protein